MKNIDKVDNRVSLLAYDRCIEFLVRMIEKYGSNYATVSIEEIIVLFPDHQCKIAVPPHFTHLQWEENQNTL